MHTSYVYGLPGTNEKMILALPEFAEIPPIELSINDDDWVRISDRDLTCDSAVRIDPKTQKPRTIKCGNWECHRTILGQCMCGLHDSVRIRAAES